MPNILIGCSIVVYRQSALDNLQTRILIKTKLFLDHASKPGELFVYIYYALHNNKELANFDLDTLIFFWLLLVCIFSFPEP